MTKYHVHEISILYRSNTIVLNECYKTVNVLYIDNNRKV